VAHGQLSVRLLLTGDPPFREGTIFCILCPLQGETFLQKSGQGRHHPSSEAKPFQELLRDSVKGYTKL